jgi:UDP-N-acetylglucosamine 4,6-dehydratase/5-epimerase
MNLRSSDPKNTSTRKMKKILITGGTGSFGKQFVASLFERHPEIERVVVFSRDELKQFQMSQSYPDKKFPAIRFFIGDIRDPDRIRRALEGIDTVIHAAALKHVPIAEYNPFECIKTNVLGAQNLIEACLDTGVRQVIALSTDKAAAPVNLYGATKLCSDKLFIAANNIVGTRDLRFSVVRYGNVMGSRGSVIPFFLEKKRDGVLPITDPRMTRFNIRLSEAADMVFWALHNGRGGEVLVPKIPSYRILDLAEAVCPTCTKPVVGMRAGEKLHEEMITSSDSQNTVDLGNYYAILPADDMRIREEYCKATKAVPVPEGFSYSSGNNPHFLSVQELRQLIASEPCLRAA